MPLDPEAAAWLERARGNPPRSSLTVAETRTAYLKASALMADALPLPRVEDLLIAPNLCGREFWPNFSSAHDPHPILVWLHGGRYFSGDLETHDGLCRALALAARCRVLAVDYRLAPEYQFPAAVEDALAGVEWALAHSSRVAVGGDSAGGNLAAAAALLQTRVQPASLRAQVLVYPMMDPACSLPSHEEFKTGYGPGSEDMRRGWEHYLPDSAKGMSSHDERISPLFAENLAGLPPAFVLTAEYDCLRDEGEAYARKLSADGVEVKHKRYEGAIHGFFQMPKVMRLAGAAIVETGEFLRSHF